MLFRSRTVYVDSYPVERAETKGIKNVRDMKIRYQQDHLTPTVSLPINFILTYMLIDRIYWIWERLPEIRSKIRLDKTFSVSESTTLLLDIGTDPHAETSVHI